MALVFLSDVSTKLNNTLINEKDIYIINDEKSLYGQILYSIDYMMNAGFDIIYFASNENYPYIISLANKVSKIHSSRNITIIDIDSHLIGRNNLVYRLSSAKNIKKLISQYQLKASSIVNEQLIPLDEKVLNY